jgi:hypothetical protein
LEHREIRFKILYTLYNKHYSDQLGHQQQTDKVIEESGLSNIDKNEVYGDVVYLENKGLVKGQSALGYAYPLWMIITSYGIDTVENAVNNFIKNLDLLEAVDPEIKKEIKIISKTEQSTSSKIRIVFNYLDRLHLLILLANEIAKIASGHL